jgi:hypothetical protein
MRNLQGLWRSGQILVLGLILSGAGCSTSAPFDGSDETRGPAPLRMPGPEKKDCETYEDRLTGGQVFTMYCSYCHNAPALAERPFSNFQNVAAHMRVRANLTGKEYAKVVVWLRRWHDVPPPAQNEEPGPKRFIYSQPIAELRQSQPKTEVDLPAGPRPGFESELSVGQPPPGNSPREGR